MKFTEPLFSLQALHEFHLHINEKNKDKLYKNCEKGNGIIGMMTG